MNEQEVKDALAALALTLEGKSKGEIKGALEAFESKNKEFMTAEIKSAVDAVKADNKEVADAMQKHLDTLDLKLQAKSKQEAGNVDHIKATIKSNFESIQTVENGSVKQFKAALPLEVKAVGDMTTANLSGDEPRDYNFDVVMFPNQKVNVSDLTGMVNISGGTYTFTREVTGEGSISDQTEGASKSQIDYDFLNVDVATNFLAGFARYSKKMRNNLPYLQSFIPRALRRDYAKAENAAFNTVLTAEATASTEVITGQNKVEMLIAEIAKLDGLDRDVNAIALTPADYWDIMITEKSTGAGYGLPGVVTQDGGVLRINGIPLVKATWVAADNYYVADWSRINKIVTEGLSLAFSEEDSDNFVKNMITARIESQIALAVEDKLSIVLGDFTAI